MIKPLAVERPAAADEGKVEAGTERGGAVGNVQVEHNAYNFQL